MVTVERIGKIPDLEIRISFMIFNSQYTSVIKGIREKEELVGLVKAHTKSVLRLNLLTFYAMCHTHMRTYKIGTDATNILYLSTEAASERASSASFAELAKMGSLVNEFMSDNEITDSAIGSFAESITEFSNKILAKI